MINIREQRFEFEVDGKRIPAAYTAPAEETVKWCVVLIPGSGPSDIDGNYPEGGMWPGRTNILRDLANQFESNGVACFRFSRSEMTTVDEAKAVAFKQFDHRVVVAEAACRSAQATAPKGTRIAVAGHSEGSVVASMLCSGPHAADIHAMISLSGPAHRFYDLMLLGAERRSTDGVMRMGPMTLSLDLYKKSVECARQGTPAPPELDIMPFGFHKMDADAQTYLRGYDAIDNYEWIAKVPYPLLIVQGAADQSVSFENGDRLVEARRAAGRPVEKAFFNGLDHMYRKAGREMPDDAVAGAIASWLATID